MEKDGVLLARRRSGGGEFLKTNLIS